MTRLSPATAVPSPPGRRGYLETRAGMQFSVSGLLATMACGLPYAVAAAVAYPNRQVVAMVGDGGFTMLMVRACHLGSNTNCPSK